MVNGYVDIYKDNRRKHLRTHTVSNRRSIITTGLKIFCLSMLSTELALSTMAVKPKITAFKTLSNNGKCYYWYWGARWLSGRVSDSGARGRGFETYRRRVVSLSKTLYSPKVLVNYPGSGGSVPT